MHGTSSSGTLSPKWMESMMAFVFSFSIFAAWYSPTMSKPPTGSSHSSQGYAARIPAAHVTLRWNREPTTPPIPPVTPAMMSHLTKVWVNCRMVFASCFSSSTAVRFLPERFAHARFFII